MLWRRQHWKDDNQAWNVTKGWDDQPVLWSHPANSKRSQSSSILTKLVPIRSTTPPSPSNTYWADLRECLPPFQRFDVFVLFWIYLSRNTWLWTVRRIRKLIPSSDIFTHDEYWNCVSFPCLKFCSDTCKVWLGLRKNRFSAKEAG